MTAVACPRCTSWCTDHEHEADQCGSASVRVAPGCTVWLTQARDGEPVVELDAADNASLSLHDAEALAHALSDLRRFGTRHRRRPFSRVRDALHDVATSQLERVPVVVVTRKGLDRRLESSVELGRDIERLLMAPPELTPVRRRHLELVHDAG